MDDLAEIIAGAYNLWQSPDFVNPSDMCLWDILAKELYLKGFLSEKGQQLYQTSPAGGPNKNEFSGIDWANL